MTSTARRTVAALALGAALVTTGCATPADRAATVDGRVITETELQQATQEINRMSPPLVESKVSPSAVLGVLIQAPTLFEVLGPKGAVVSDSVALKKAQEHGIENPSQATLDVLRFDATIQGANTSGTVTQADGEAFAEKIDALDIKVNPRYGTYDAKDRQIKAVTAPWVTLTDAPQ